MTAPEPTLPPERVEELANWLTRCRVEDAPNPLLPDKGDRIHVAHMIGLKVAGWLAEARQEGRIEQLTKAERTEFAAVYGYRSGHADGAAEVRERIEALIDAEGLSGSRFHAIRALDAMLRDALAEPEDRR